MRLSEWLPQYRQICAEFGFSEEEDIASAHLLAQLLLPKAKDCIETMNHLSMTKATEAYICGGGSNLKGELESIPKDAFIVAADGATTQILDLGLLPDLIVTDLDGDVGDQIDANARGATVVVHAHGDNTEALKEYVDSFTGRIIGTCQCEPVTGLFNFGGFTDGDRAVCIAKELGVAKAYLGGFDFSHPSDKPGKRKDIKLMKLRWAERIIASQSGPRFLVLSLSGKG